MLGFGPTPVAPMSGVRVWMKDGTAGMTCGMPEALAPPKACTWPEDNATLRSWRLLR